jgi:hypothetical protein
MVAVMSKPTYRVDAQRHDGWWLLTSPDVPGAVSQVRRLTAADEHAREAIAFVLDVEPGSFDLVLVPVLSRGIADDVFKARAAVEAAAKAQREAADESRKVVAELLESEQLTGAEVAALLGLSPQRVSQLARAQPARRPAAKAAVSRVAAKKAPAVRATATSATSVRP